MNSLTFFVPQDTLKYYLLHLSRRRESRGLGRSIYDLDPEGTDPRVGDVGRTTSVWERGLYPPIELPVVHNS